MLLFVPISSVGSPSVSVAVRATKSAVIVNLEYFGSSGFASQFFTPLFREKWPQLQLLVYFCEFARQR